MIHIGIGETQLNNLLPTLNLPTISKRALKAREREIGEIVETIALKSTKDALNEEVCALNAK